MNGAGAISAAIPRAAEIAAPAAAGKLQYRAYIDGLRAVAVLAVLVFHAFPQALPGGYAGVDVFFVISGFLISGIILTDLRENTFSFIEFYRRRIRRIFPALALVICSCMVFGWLALLPGDFHLLGANVAASAVFSSNFELWSESGYFDTAAELKPLLHLWSLGVEEQYYLLWPLALVLFCGRLRRIHSLMILIVVGSFAINLFLAIREPSAAFYFPVSRFWELMLGSGIAYLHVCRHGLWLFSAEEGSARHSACGRERILAPNFIAIGGIALVTTGFLMLDPNRNTPYWMLLPCLGAVLLILAGPNAWLNRCILAHPRVVFIGIISYPLYLWHWPLLTFSRIVLGTVSPVVRLLILAASVLLAWATYQFVERKVRYATFQNPRVVPALVLSVSALGAMGLLASVNVLPAHSASVPHLVAISAAISDRTYHGDRVIPGDTTRSVVFFGDSHMQQYLPRIEWIAEKRSAPIRTLVLWTRPGCAPVPELERRGRRCAGFVSKGFALASKPEVDTVVIAASWVGMAERKDFYKAGQSEDIHFRLLSPGAAWALQGFERALGKLTAQGKHVVLVLSSPRGDPFSPRQMVTRNGFSFHVSIPPPVSRVEATADNAFIDDRIREIARRIGAELIDPMDELCTTTVCPTVDKDGNPLFTDETHLRSSTVRARFKAFDRYVYLPSVLPRN